MRPDADLLATMKTALIRANDDLLRAAAQARLLREAMERMSPADLATATQVRDGTSDIQVVDRTCQALDEMREGYDSLRKTIQRRTERHHSSPSAN